MSGHGDSLARDFRAAADVARLEPHLDRTHGGDVDAWARSAGIEAGEILDFSASINPLGPPRSARRAFIKSYGEISRYPDAYGEKLKGALAERHGMNSAEVLHRQRFDPTYLSVVRRPAPAQGIDCQSGIFRIRQCVGAWRSECAPVYSNGCGRLQVLDAAVYDCMGQRLRHRLYRDAQWRDGSVDSKNSDSNHRARRFDEKNLCRHRRSFHRLRRGGIRQDAGAARIPT